MKHKKGSSKVEKRAKGRKAQGPESLDDYLEAAEDEEQGGRKWRLSDPVKAVRFFRRAIDVYDAGLQNFPRSFDLAYNKAVLQFQLSQDEHISPHFGKPLEVLEETLNSHRVVRSIDETDSNTLYNTAQVLVSMAETLAESYPDKKHEAIDLLREAIELFSSCLTKQELEYSEVMELQGLDIKDANDDEDIVMSEGVSVQESTAEVNTETELVDRNAYHDEQGDLTSEKIETAVEPAIPVSAEELQETAQAELTALTMLVSLYAPDRGASIEALVELTRPLVEEKIPYYLSLTADSRRGTLQAPSLSLEAVPHSSQRRVEVGMNIANWNAALASAQYRSRQIDHRTYASRVERAFSSLLDLPEDTPWLVIPDSDLYPLKQFSHTDRLPFSEALYPFADALVEYADAIAELENINHYDLNAVSRLVALTAAHTLLLSGSDETHFESNAQRARVLISIGDINLQRLELLRLPGAPQELTLQREKIALEAEECFEKAGECLSDTQTKLDPDGSLRIGGAHAKSVKEKQMEVEAAVKRAVAALIRSETDGGVGLVDRRLSDKLLSFAPESVEHVLQDMVDEGLMQDSLDELKARLGR